jgi:hypothetical protein
MQYLTFGGLFLCSAVAFAGNPVLRVSDPDFLYVADPAAEVFNGKVYVYCSHDQADAVNYEGMKDYVILESSDMKTWVNHGVVLDPQLDEGFEYAHSNMNAPDAAYKDGWYYWYFPSDVTYVGVAKSRTPVGPWQSAVSNEITAIFDPTVIVDDDGQAYIYGNDHWIDIGDPGSHIMGAKLKDNMVELDGPWVRLSRELVNEAVHVFKREGIYYFSARVGGVTQYWMADSPLPEFATFKGELAPNSPYSPNHTSAIEFDDQWYLFYHRGDVNHGSHCRRSVCFDKMYFRDDGSIDPIVYTLDPGVELTVPEPLKRSRSAYQVAIPPVGVSIRHEAESFVDSTDVKLETSFDGGRSQVVGDLSDGDWTRYDNIHFGNNAEPITFRVRVASLNSGGRIELRLGDPRGILVGTVPVGSTGSWDVYQTIEIVLNGIRGSHTLYLCYQGDSDQLFKLNWFEWIPPARKRSH